MRTSALVLMATLLFVAGCGSDGGTVSRPDGSGNAGRGAAAAGKPSRTPTDLADICDAEEHGKAHPKVSAPSEKVPDFRADAPGATERECVEMPTGTVDSPGETVRSGEFVAAFEYFHTDGGPREAKIPWVPLHLKEWRSDGSGKPGDSDKPLNMTVRVASLAEPTKIVTRRLDQVASTNESFYPSGTPLPGEGPWRMVATWGPDWGCFDLKPS